jgi:tubulin polyglutamylase TTLL5
MSRGRGIKLINNISNLHYKQNCVIQKYIENPLLVNGKKFDLRLYVLVTQFYPLEAFIYKEGFARFATLKYSTETNSLDNLFIHLTNTAIAEKHSTYGYEESKCTLGELRSKLSISSPEIDFDDLWNRIVNVVLKSLCSVEEFIGTSDGSSRNTTTTNTRGLTLQKSQVNSFEVFGYDIMIDNNLKPWLIEVNASPSMECNVQIDNIKTDMIKDTIALVNPMYFNRTELQNVLTRRQDNKQRKMSQQQKELNRDLTKILNGQLPRRYGQTPIHLGNYQQISPSKMYTVINRVKRHL